jgi:hypothetical protein
MLFDEDEYVERRGAPFKVVVHSGDRTAGIQEENVTSAQIGV